MKKFFGRGSALKNRASRLRDEYTKDPKQCKLCNKPLSFERKSMKYCGRKCAGIASMYDAPIESRIVNGVEMSVRDCPTCGKEIFHTRRSNAIRMFVEKRSCRKCGKRQIAYTTVAAMTITQLLRWRRFPRE
jgi:predicted RNA-binding Zn-ribbon protein involved in translation (DUF1610 family)